MSSKFEIYSGLYLSGDCSGYCRGIVQSGIMGMLVGRNIISKDSVNGGM